MFPHPHQQRCSLKALDIEVFIVMRAALMLFVFRVSISVCKNARFMAISFSMIEVACWSVSMTSTNSASHLLKSFASSVGYLFWDVKSHLFSTASSLLIPSETCLLISPNQTFTLLIDFCTNCNCEISIFFWTLWTWICFCFTIWNCTCGICSLLSVLCCTTGINHFVAEPFLRHIDCFFSSPLRLWDLSASSTTLLMNCGCATQLSPASAGPSGPVCACSCGASFITATVSSKIDSGKSTSMICSTIRSGTCS